MEFSVFDVTNAQDTECIAKSARQSLATQQSVDIGHTLLTARHMLDDIAVTNTCDTLIYASTIPMDNCTAFPTRESNPARGLACIR